jgi:hypothetical protein
MVLYGIVVILVCMQGWKEKAFELIRWEIKGVPILYPLAFIVSLIPILFWNTKNICCFGAFTIADDSARYLLSALVQSLATIIAIVVTLTLVALQLTASAYSPRVIDIFKKDWIMWLLLVLYGLSIFFGLFVLEMIGGTYQNLIRLGVSLEFCVFLVYSMGVIAFVGLFCHVGNVISILNPENIIKRLSEDITRENVLKHIKSVEANKKDRKKPVDKDPILPIVDIIRSSIMKYNYELAKNGLEAIADRTIEICNLNKYLDIESDIISISRHFCYHLSLIGIFAVRNMNEIHIEVSRNLKIFGVSMAEKGFEGTAAISAESILQFGTIAVQKGIDASIQTAKPLAELINSSEYYVSLMMEEYELELIKEGDEEEIAAFQKLMKKCGQELEKLRAEVSK